MNPSSSAAPSDAASAPHLAPEAASPTPFGAPAAFGPASGSGKGKTIALICVSVLAVVGIGFSVYAFLNSSKKDQEISDLKVQIQTQSGTMTTMETPEIQTTTEDGSSIVISPENFVYIPEWGIKIKIVDGLHVFGSGLHINQDGFISFGIAGTDCRDNARCQSAPLFASVYDGPQLAALTRTPEGSAEGGDTNMIYGQKVITLDGYDYFYNHPQAVFSTNPTEQQWEADTVALIQEMLTNTDNYSSL